MMTKAEDQFINFANVRADFPRAESNLWLAAAERHPYPRPVHDAMKRYIDGCTFGGSFSEHGFSVEKQQATKAQFATLINAQPSEIAYIQSTTDGENIILAGLGLSQPDKRHQGNIVIDDLHFQASKYIYTELEKQGNIELRIVPHRDWQTSAADFEEFIDDDTRLVSVALVSQLNGYVADVAAISRIAHAHGAHLYADVIQAAGCVSIDVKSMGIDFAACNAYKWLMGDFGIGFLYIREDLQEKVKRTRFSMRQVQTVDDFAFAQRSGAFKYEGSNFSHLSGICVRHGLAYLSSIGVERIRNHVKPLTEKLQSSLPQLGYTPITPPNTESPIVSFLPQNVDETQSKLDHAFGHQVASFRDWHWTNGGGQRKKVEGIRFGISVYNNDEDIDKLLNALD